MVNGVHHGDRREELLRLMVQSLTNMGYRDSASLLQKESGVILESATVTKFRSAILSGDWATAESLVPMLEVQQKSGDQKYLELIEENSIPKALVVLRNELSPVCLDSNVLHRLSCLMMCSDKADLMRQSNWDGAAGNSRSQLLLELQKHIPARVMLPENRLEALIEQALSLQRLNCLYHNVREGVESLYGDHSCDRMSFPCETRHVLAEHTDEVWFLSFSPNGKYLASASKDTTAIIWRTTNFDVAHTLRGHHEAISFLAWNPASTILLTGSNDSSLKTWDAQTGVCTRSFSRHTEPITSCAWLPDGRHFVSSSIDKNIMLWSLDGEILHKWNGVRVTDISVTADGKLLVAISDKRIRLYNLSTKEEVGSIQETDSITSVFGSFDSKHVLVNLSGCQEIHLWDIESKRLVRKYVGHKQGLFVIRSCFGGISQNFVLSGSEDSRIYVWHRERGVVLEELSGHSGMRKRLFLCVRNE
ncbi:hypothetical protein HDU76_001580 [Blyttiomyces sp. JEL0837]|nr:hypothetical protein HDU76_001580 [Blyttiomyces sp. JEL0837]